MSKHKIIHKKVYCELCKIYCSKQNYKRHQIEKHHNNNIGSEHQCDTCLKTFGRSDTLLRHKKSCTLHKCEICSEAFTSVMRFMKHMKVHSSLDPLNNRKVGINCSDCGKQFAQEKYLKVHMNVHKPKELEESLSCNYCQKLYANKFSLSRHIKSKHENPRVIVNESIGFMILDDENAPYFQNIE